MAAARFECAEDQEVEIKRHGFLGYGRFCTSEGIKHGPFEDWEGQHLDTRGSYVNGLEDGEWQLFDKKGNLIQTVFYKDGKEVSRTDEP